ncbi:hypothetical protein CQW23_18556 [Capsicum baccatum]|uniref:USP domain-containing protein n=1 Tax=Capsicum baccatum TaxID=33114 RepID=A0A2G2W389_CAPBA|nr:hypothetical protein CQW23_18556 [Capsicum baccatum]
MEKEKAHEEEEEIDKEEVEKQAEGKEKEEVEEENGVAEETTTVGEEKEEAKKEKKVEEALAAADAEKKENKFGIIGVGEMLVSSNFCGIVHLPSEGTTLIAFEYVRSSSSSDDDDSDTMDIEWFADDGPMDAKPIASIEPKYDFEVKPIAESKYDFEVKPIRSLDPKCDFEVKPINSVGPKCDFEAEPIELVRPKCDFEAKPVKSLDLKCDFLRENEENKLVRTSNVLKTYKFVVFNIMKILDFTSGFHKYEQEDAHEFLLCFLNRLESRCSDIVQQVFCICLVSKLRCCNCGHYSNTYEPLIDVSLEIKDVNILHSALESFTRVEKLDDPEIKFSCERCKEQIKYDLYAVIVHVESTSSLGHYYCFICAEPNEWYKFDDSMISRVHEDLVLAEKAYIMFYAKRDTLRFLDFVALQMHNVGTIPKLSFSLPNHHASDVSEANAAAIDTSLSSPRPIFS